MLYYDKDAKEYVLHTHERNVFMINPSSATRFGIAVMPFMWLPVVFAMVMVETMKK